jgi:colanic acid/amylovoran biosynthesis glycosyltransferase
MTIAFSHYSLEKDISGVTTWLERFILRIHADGYPVSILLHSLGNGIESEGIYQTLSHAGVTVEKTKKPYYTEDGMKKTLQFLNRQQPKIFIPQCLESMYYAAAFAGKVGLPWIYTIHSDDPVYWAIADAIQVEDHGGKTVGVSSHISQIVRQKRLSDMPETIPYGVPTINQKAAFCDQPFRVVFCGRVIEEQKRISLVLESMAQACILDPRIECVILGDGPALSSCRQWVETQGLVDRILFRGRLSPDKVYEELASTQILLLMSDYEGLPLAVMEAMSVGVVPVVSYINSGIPELVQDGVTGLMIDEKPINAAAAIQYLINKPAVWERLSNASQDLIAKSYSDDICYKRWLNLIESISASTDVSYPIKIPQRITLPSFNPILKGRDNRHDKVKLSVKKIFAKAFQRLFYGD